MKAERSSCYLSVIAVDGPKGRCGMHKKIKDPKHFWNVRRSKFATLGRDYIVAVIQPNPLRKRRVDIPLPLWVRAEDLQPPI